MPETIIDFGGFTVDVSKIDWIDTAEVVPSLFVRIGNTGLWLGDNDAKTLKEAHEKHLARHQDGWYWVGNYGLRPLLLYIKDEQTYFPDGSIAHRDLSKADYVRPFLSDDIPGGFIAASKSI